MGGVKTDDKGATNIGGLYAIGEVASSGVHGANRLASNSLLEAIVFAKRLADHLVEQNTVSAEHSEIQVRVPESVMHPAPFVFPEMELMRSSMTNSIGILRNKEQLSAFITKYPLLPVHDLLTLSNENISKYHQTTACSLLAAAAYLRNESRGAHFRTDTPSQRDEWQGKVIELSIAGSAITNRKIHSKETV